MGPSPKDAMVRRSAPVQASAASAYRSAPLASAYRANSIQASIGFY